MDLILNHYSEVEILNIRQREKFRILYADFFVLSAADSRMAGKFASMEYKLSQGGEIYKPKLIAIDEVTGTIEECSIATVGILSDHGCSQLSVGDTYGVERLVSARLQHSTIRGKRFKLGTHSDILRIRRWTPEENAIEAWIRDTDYTLPSQRAMASEARNAFTIRKSNPDDFSSSVSDADITELFEG